MDSMESKLLGQKYNGEKKGQRGEEKDSSSIFFWKHSINKERTCKRIP